MLVSLLRAKGFTITEFFSFTIIKHLHPFTFIHEKTGIPTSASFNQTNQTFTITLQESIDDEGRLPYFLVFYEPSL